MSRPTANLRMFVAVYPPPDAARALLGLLGSVDLPAHRVTPIEQVHLTLQFIGDVPQAELGSVIESVERSAAGVARFRLEAASLVFLPPGPRARVVAASVDSPAPEVLEIQTRLARRLSRARARPGDRFTPHLTLARFEVQGARRGPAPERVLIAPVGFEVREVVLMRSTLGASGAVHHRVCGVELT